VAPRALANGGPVADGGLANQGVRSMANKSKPATKPVVSEKTAMKSTGPQGHS
jgi:hypothetical protein